MTERIDHAQPTSAVAIFSATAAGLTFALTVARRSAGDLVGEAAGTQADAALSPNVWLTIATDGTITIVSPAAEMGQGTFTDAAGDHRRRARRRLVQGQGRSMPPGWDDKKLRQSGLRRRPFQTSASFAVRGYFKPMRIAGAQARRVLLDAVGGEMGRAGRRACHRAERRRAQGLRTAASATARSRPSPRRRPNCRRSRRRTSRPPRASAHRQGSCRASKCRSRSPARPNTASTCRCPAWSMPRCCNRPIRAARRRRWTMTRGAAGPGRHRHRQAARRRRRDRHQRSRPRRPPRTCSR